MCATGVAVAYTSNGGPADAAKDQFGVLVSHLSENAYSTTVKPIKLSDVAWIRGVSDDDLLDVTTTYWDDTNVMMYWQGDPPKNRKVRRLYNLLLVCLMTAVRCRTQGSTLDMIMKKCITNRSASRAEDLSADYERYVAFLCAQRKIFAAADWDNEEHKALLNLLKLVGTALAVDFTTNDGSQAVQYEDILRQLTTIDNEAGQALIVMNELYSRGWIPQPVRDSRAVLPDNFAGGYANCHERCVRLSIRCCSDVRSLAGVSLLQSWQHRTSTGVNRYQSFTKEATLFSSFNFPTITTSTS